MIRINSKTILRGLTKIGKTFIEIPNGQIEYIISGTYLFTVPENVTSVSVVVVGGGNGAGSLTTSRGTSHFNNSVYAYGSDGRIGGSHSGTDGGGNGGNGGTSDGNNGGGGGGAGGYSGNGGNGGDINVGNDGFPGTGGGAGGGSGARDQQTSKPGFGGSNGETPSLVGRGGKFGGGDNLYLAAGKGGGGLGYKNNITVTPGQSIPIKVGEGFNATLGGAGAVRIIWGNNRSFPSTNTVDL